MCACPRVCVCVYVCVCVCVYDQAFQIADINECQISRPCLNNGICINTPGSFTCNCQSGYTGEYCQIGNLINSLYIYIYIYI